MSRKKNYVVNNTAYLNYRFDRGILGSTQRSLIHVPKEQTTYSCIYIKLCCQLIEQCKHSQLSSVTETTLSVEICEKSCVYYLFNMAWSLILGAVALCGFTEALPTKMEHMTISKMRMADLETSASGYVYSQQQGLPASYVQYTNHGTGRYYHAPDTVHYVVDAAAAPVASIVSDSAAHYQPALLAYTTAENQVLPYVEQQPYAKADVANYAIQELPKYAPTKQETRASYYEENKNGDDADTSSKHEDESDDEDDKDNDEKNDHAKENDDGNDHDEDDHDDDDNDHDEDDDDHDTHNFEGPAKFDFHGDHSSGKVVGIQSEVPSKNFGSEGHGGSFDAGSGKQSSAAEYSSGGEEGEKGYKSHHEFDKGEKGHYDSENKKGYYDEEGGHKKSNSEDAGEYGSDHDEEKSESGSEFGKKSSHKKGEKTSGYHNVYHKDEYKKDSDFYDDDHKEGHFEKFGFLNKHHKAEEGGFKKGGSHNSGFEHGEQGKKGSYDKGHHDSQDQGYKAAEGEDSYHDNYSDYAKEGSQSSGKKHGFSNNNGHH